MISVDDVTLTAQVPYQVKMRSLVQGQPITTQYRVGPGGQTHLWRYTWRRGLVVGWCESTSTVEYKISVPRLWGTTANFPLPHYDSVQDWPLVEVCNDIVGCLGLPRTSQPTIDAGLRAAGVRRIAYALDFECEDIPGTLRALGSSRRRGQLPDRFSSTGAQWSLSGRYRLQIYDKGEQLRIDKQYGKLERQLLAERAEGILRVELTLGSPKHIRAAIGVARGAVLPWLPLMGAPIVAARVFRREFFDRLHLDRVHEPEPSFFEGLDVSNLHRPRELDKAMALAAGLIAGWAREYRTATDSTAKAGITAQQILLGFLETAGMGDEAILGTLNMTPRQLAERRRDLRRLGPPEQYSRILLRQLLDAFRRQCPDEEHLWTVSEDLINKNLVPAPWASEDDFDVADDGSARSAESTVEDLFAQYADDIDLDEVLDAA